MLVFPSKSSAADVAGSLGDWHLNEFAGDAAAALRWLIVGNGNQSVAVDGFHETIAQGIGGGAEGANGFAARRALLRLRTNRAVIHQRAAGNRVGAIIDEDGGVHELAKAVAVTHAQLGDLADAAGHGILVAIGARLLVVDRSQTIGDGFLLFEMLLVVREAVAGRLSQPVARAAADARRIRPVWAAGRCGETGGRFAGGRGLRRTCQSQREDQSCYDKPGTMVGKVYAGHSSSPCWAKTQAMVRLNKSQCFGSGAGAGRRSSLTRKTGNC